MLVGGLAANTYSTYGIIYVYYQSLPMGNGSLRDNFCSCLTDGTGFISLLAGVFTVTLHPIQHVHAMTGRSRPSAHRYAALSHLLITCADLYFTSLSHYYRAFADNAAGKHGVALVRLTL